MSIKNLDPVVNLWFFNFTCTTFPKPRFSINNINCPTT